MTIQEPAQPVTQTDEATPVLFVTDKAANTIQNVLDQRGLQGYALRVAVSGGGCYGMQYQMAFEETARPNDTVVAAGGVQIVVDPDSLVYLTGATIDFADDLMGGGFRIENPNTVSSCGCGSSFKAEGSSGGGSGCGTCSH